MPKHRYQDMLQSALTERRCSLLGLYELRDRLRYIEGPRLKKAYEELFGADEE